MGGVRECSNITYSSFGHWGLMEAGFMGKGYGVWGGEMGGWIGYLVVGGSIASLGTRGPKVGKLRGVKVKGWCWLDGGR